MTRVRAAMILAAGLGTRLRPLTDELAKPLVPVGDGPAIGDVLGRVRAALPDVLVVANAHHQPEELRAFCEASRVALSYEPILLGTAGGMAAAAELLGRGDVLVWNGDILAPLDVSALIAAHEETPRDATLVVRPSPRGEGNVGFDAAGRIVRLRTTRFGDEERGGHFLGIHVIGAPLRDRLPAQGCLVGDVYLPALAEGALLRAFETDVGFVDVGTIAAYLEANRAWLRARGLDAWAHATATVNAPIHGSVVGARARVNAPVQRCVVWPDAVVDAPLADAVVTTRGIVFATRG